MNRVVLLLLTAFGGTLFHSTLWAADPWESNQFAADPGTAKYDFRLETQLGLSSPALPSAANAEFEPVSLQEFADARVSELIASNLIHSANHAIGTFALTATIDSELAAPSKSLEDPLAQLRFTSGSPFAIEPSQLENHMLRMQSALVPARFEAMPALERPAILGIRSGNAWLGVYRP